MTSLLAHHPLRALAGLVSGHDIQHICGKPILRNVAPLGRDVPTQQVVAMKFHEFVCKIGVFGNHIVYLNELLAHGVSVHGLHHVLKRITYRSDVAIVTLCGATASELGLPHDAPIESIAHRVIELGYKLCEPEIGVALRLQYLSQPNGDWRSVLIEPFPHARGEMVYVMDLVNRSHTATPHLTLNVYAAQPGTKVNMRSPECVYVFQKA